MFCNVMSRFKIYFTDAEEKGLNKTAYEDTS